MFLYQRMRSQYKRLLECVINNLGSPVMPFNPQFSVLLMPFSFCYPFKLTHTIAVSTLSNPTQPISASFIASLCHSLAVFLTVCAAWIEFIPLLCRWRGKGFKNFVVAALSRNGFTPGTGFGLDHYWIWCREKETSVPGVYFFLWYSLTLDKLRGVDYWLLLAHKPLIKEGCVLGP